MSSKSILKIIAREIWLFYYPSGHRATPPRADLAALKINGKKIY
jgi:hypothetical protein